MTRFRPLFALVSGLILCFVMVYVGGYLAAIAIPKAYFDLFTRSHLLLALTIEEAIVFALPCFLLALGWTLLTLRTLTPTRWVCLSYAAGIVIGWGGMQLDFALEFSKSEYATSMSTFQLARWLLLPAAYSVLNTLSLPMGVLVGSLASRRRLRTVAT